MSAIDCTFDIERRAHEGGDRVRIPLDGTFLPYAWRRLLRQGARAPTARRLTGCARGT